MATGEPAGTFATLTHARLRAAQGDVDGAARILRVILAAQPEHREARSFLAELEDRVPITYRDPEPVAAEVVQPAVAAELTVRFRKALDGGRNAAPLTRWIERVRRNRGVRRVR
jgi:D-serine deaminase-like pyridoxal phosphate-dependent protein